MSRGRDASTQLERALTASGATAGLAIGIVESAATQWASATFSGERHVLTIGCAPALRAGAWLGQLADAQLPLRGHLVADLAVVRRTRVGDLVSATIEALTVVDR